MKRKEYSMDGMRLRVRNAKWRLLMAGVALMCFASLAFFMYGEKG